MAAYLSITSTIQLCVTVYLDLLWRYVDGSTGSGPC